MSVETNPHNYTNINLIFSQFMPARISPKENSGASGGFLPRPLSAGGKSAEAKRKILSPKNSFAKTSSALKPHALPEYLEAVAGLIHSFSFRSKKVRAKCIITAQVTTGAGERT